MDQDEGLSQGSELNDLLKVDTARHDDQPLLYQHRRRSQLEQRRLYQTYLTTHACADDSLRRSGSHSDWSFRSLFQIVDAGLELTLSGTAKAYG